MNCDDARALFSEYYDGEDFDMLAAFSAHLLECSECAEEYNQYAQLMDEVRALPAPVLPVGFHATLMRQVRSASLRKRRGFYMPIVAAAASVLILGFWFAWAFDNDANFAPAPAPAPAVMMDAPTMDVVAPAPAAGAPMPEMFSPMYETRMIEPPQFRVEPHQFGAFAEAANEYGDFIESFDTSARGVEVVYDMPVGLEIYWNIQDDSVAWSSDESWSLDVAITEAVETEAIVTEAIATEAIVIEEVFTQEEALLLDEIQEEPRSIFSINQLLGMISFVGLLISIRLMTSFKRRR